MKGDTTYPVLPTYGNLGIPNTNNEPGNLNIEYYWSDASNNLWLGGNAGAAQVSNDLWKYTPFTSLPVFLIRFEGKNNGDRTTLVWKTEAEINLNRFEVERSFNGSNFQYLGILSATNAGQYQFIDHTEEARLQTCFYRLKMIDNDGKYVYSKIVVINPLNDNNIVVNPNPATSVVNINFSNLISGDISIEITDIEGRIVKKELYKLLSTSISMNIASLPPGNYVLGVFNKGHKYVKVFTIRR